MCPNEPQNCEIRKLSLTECPVVNIHIVSVGSSLFLEVKGQILILQTIAKTWQVKHYKETRNVGLWLLWLSVSIIQFLPKWFHCKNSWQAETTEWKWKDCLSCHWEGRQRELERDLANSKSDSVSIRSTDEGEKLWMCLNTHSDGIWPSEGLIWDWEVS